MTDAVLVLNAGSSSLKFALFELRAELENGAPAHVAGALARLAGGQIEGLGVAPHFIAKDASGQVLTEKRWPAADAPDHEAFLPELFTWVEEHLGGDRLIAVGHRIVHGGEAFRQPTRLDDNVLRALEAYIPLAPLHQPHNLAAVRAAMAARPGLLQVGAFDTAFHASLSPTATRFGLPRAYHDAGVRRYGFHGLSYEFIAGRLGELDPELARGRVIAAHLGAGASLCALKDGRSLDTTMGFTALEGLMMATRAGALDPGVVLYFLQHQGLDAGAIEDLLYKRSGLLGVSGLSADMRTLLDSDRLEAAEAVALFVHRIVREIGALSAMLEGLDGLVFTAGIGENAAAIRARVAERLAWLGADLDPEANAAGPAARRISTPSSRLALWVIPTDEELTIARHALEVAG